MSHSFFAYIFRMRYIARWALMRNTRTENVEEHSYEVAVLAHALAVIGRDVFHKDVSPEKAAAAAGRHSEMARLEKKIKRHYYMTTLIEELGRRPERDF